jgi:hypothetical protein
MRQEPASVQPERINFGGLFVGRVQQKKENWTSMQNFHCKLDLNGIYCFLYLINTKNL